MPTRTGYTFGGYYTAANGGGTQYYNADGTSAHIWDKTAATALYAKWTANTYTVMLDGQSATTAGTTEVTATYDAAMPTITVPTRTGYTFGGYYTAANGGGTKYYNADGSSAHIWDKTAATTTLYAKWTAISYNITYNLNGGTLETDKNSYTIESPDIILDTPIRTGFIFDGWYTNSGLTGTAVTTIDHGSTGDKQFWAKWLVPNIPYIDADGTTQYCSNYTKLTGGDAQTLSGGWYVAQGTVNYTGTLTLTGDVHLILADDCTLNIGTEDARIGDNCIYGYDSDSGECYSLTIYGQTDQSGKFYAYNSVYQTAVLQNYTQHGGNVTIDASNYDALFLTDGDLTLTRGTLTANGSSDAIRLKKENVSTLKAIVSGGTLNATANQAINGSLVINGGTVTATATNGNGIAIDGTVTMNGGTLTANASNYGIWGSVTMNGGSLTATATNGILGNVTLGLRNATDYITASSYQGTVTIADGQTLIDGTHAYSGTLNDGQKNDLRGQTLQLPVPVTLADGITATTGIVEIGGKYYAKAGATVTVSTSSVTAPEGYTLGGITVSPAVTVTDLGGGSYSFTMPAADVTVRCAVIVSYIDAEGKPASHEAIALDGTESSLDAGWYFVGADISRSGTIDCDGNVNIILCDGKTMTVSDGRSGIFGYSGGTLTIYGQTLGTGTLNATGTNCGINHYGNVVIRGGTVNATGTYAAGIYAGGYITISGGRVTGTGSYGISGIGSVTITGSQVSATGNENGIYSSVSVTISGGRVTATGQNGIYASSGTVSITGGEVTATDDGNHYGIYANTITLGWTNVSDFIKVSFYRGTVNIVETQTLYDEDGYDYSGTIFDIIQLTQLAGKTLRPLPNVLALDDAADNTDAISASTGQTRNVILYGRTLYKDGDWNTLCLPFSTELTGDLANADIRALSSASLSDDGVLTLNFTPATGQGAVTSITAGQPYIVKWAGSEGQYVENPVFTNVTVSSTTPADVTFTGVAFKGTYDWQEYTEVNKSILFLGTKNTLYYPQPSGGTNPTIGAFRAYFELSGSTEARQFVLNFGEETGIGHTEITEITESAGAWYTLDGVKLDGKPTKKGLYIHGGRKVVVP